MSVEDYINEKQEIQNMLISLITSEIKFDENKDYLSLIKYFSSINEKEKPKELEDLFKILLHISNNHNRNNFFFNNIEQIILYFVNDLKNNFSNLEIFDMFSTNRRILLFLFEQKIITLDQNIINAIFFRRDMFYFFNQIKALIDFDKVVTIEKILLEKDPKIFNDFDELCRQGENHSYICYLIRNDLVEKFVEYVNRTNLSLSNTKIENSIFETNSFLILKEPTLIEYAAFFGSIQIFQYLKYSGVSLKRSLWIYAIHSNSPDMIHILEENYVVPYDNSYEECFLESIKCHHNEIANYIFDNLLFKSKCIENMFTERSLKYGFQYHNYDYIHLDFCHKTVIFHLIKYNYFDLFKLLLEEKKLNVNERHKMSALRSAIEYNRNDFLNVLLNHEDIQFGPNVFENCEKIIDIKIPFKIMTIGERAFKNCRNLIDVIIPSSILSIENYAFCNCSKLEHVYIPSFLTTIQKGTFLQCSSLKSVAIPQSVTEICAFAFSECYSLKDINIPSGVTKIGEFAFFRCRSITEIELPSLITEISKSTFEGCIEMRRITIPSSLLIIGDNAFKGCYMLKKIDLPSSVIKIGKYAFNSCSSLSEFLIPPLLTEIDDGCFSNCTFTSITIPSKVKSLNKHCFENCFLLEEILFQSANIEIKCEEYLRYVKLDKIKTESSKKYKIVRYVGNLKIVLLPET